MLVGGTLAFIHPDAFPGQHEGRQWVPAPHVQPGTLLAPPPDLARGQLDPDPLRFGPWRVLLRRSGRAGLPQRPVSPRPAASLGLWEVLSGSFAYELPAHASYEIAPTERAAVPALIALGKAWPALLMAIPQVVGVGETQAREATVIIELTYDGSRKTPAGRGAP